MRSPGHLNQMKKRKVISRPIAIEEDGVSIAGGVNAVVSANVGERDAHNTVSTKQRVRVVQRKGSADVSIEQSEGPSA